MRGNKLSKLKLFEGRLFRKETDLYNYKDLFTGRTKLNKKQYNKEIIFEIKDIKNYTLRGIMLNENCIKIKGIKRGKIKF